MNVREHLTTLGNAGNDSGPLCLTSIRPGNLLSFGFESPEIQLRSLNVIVGPNGSGKSNLIEAVCLLRSTPVSFGDVIRENGGVREWIWKGRPIGPARVAAQCAVPDRRLLIHHEIAFIAEQHTVHLYEEHVADAVEIRLPEYTPANALYYYLRQFSNALIRTQSGMHVITPDALDFNDSVLAQRRDPEQYPAITYLAEQYGRIRAYREWSFGRNTIFRQPQRADIRNDRLEEDFSNLGLFLNRLRRIPAAKNAILARLRDLYEGVDDFDVSVEGGTVQVFFTEGNFVIPATRLSDGTLRYLCLLAILCDPMPPPLICIEEPELGLHPDILPKIADLLIEASSRTQLIVTTHSDILIDALTEQPESVLVCEKHDGQTQMKRLSKDDLSVWLEKYRLGELWTRGELGGTRW